MWRLSQPAAVVVLAADVDWAVAVMALAEKVAVHSAAVMEAAQAAAAALATVLSTRAQQVVAVQALHQPTARPQQ